MWYALGTNRYNTTALPERRGEPQAAFDGLCEHGFPDTIVEVCREGFRKCSEITREQHQRSVISSRVILPAVTSRTCL